MNLIRRHPLGLFVLSSLATFVALVATGMLAHAQGAAPIDPTHPVVAEQSIASLLAHHGVGWGAMFAVVGLGSWFVARNEQEHWLAQGRVLGLMSGVVGVLSAVLDVQFNGGSWTQVYALVPGVLALLWSKPAAGSKLIPPVAKLGATAALIGMLMTATGCGPTMHQIAVDSEHCALTNLSAAKGTLEGDLYTTVQGWLTDTTSTKWEARLDTLLAGAAITGLAGGAATIMCIVQAVESDLAVKVKTMLGAGTVATSPEAVGDARARAWLAKPHSVSVAQ